MIYGYYLFILLALIVIIVCATCTCCLRVRRRRNAEAAAAEQRYQQFANNENNNNNAANNFAGGVYVQGAGQGGDYGNMYYQQQQQQPPQVGVVGNTEAGMYYPSGSAGPNLSGGARPLSATVLYATPAGAEGGNVNFGNYFPEAQVAGGFQNTNNVSNMTGAGATGIPPPPESSPYGEADYVSRLPLQQTSTQPPPLGSGNAMSPPPQYPAASPTRPSNGNIVRFGGSEGAKGKELD